jgi:hypothetical protein
MGRVGKSGLIGVALDEPLQLSIYYSPSATRREVVLGSNILFTKMNTAARSNEGKLNMI